jgi:hypothetical protein
MLDPLMKDLQSKGQVDYAGDIRCKDLVKALYSNSFLQACPKYVSYRETIVNIKLITTTLIVLKRNYLTHDLIRHGLNAYTLICREEKEDYLTLSNEKK